MLMFYGWKDPEAPAAKAFLIHERSGKDYIDPTFSNIGIQKDIIFGSTVNYKGEPEDLLLDVYSPSEEKAENRPAMFLIHGGGFRPKQDKTQSYIVDMARQFAARGYVCFSTNYRTREKPKEDPEGTLNDALEDVSAALEWVRENASSLGIDPEKIVVAGGSAGGMIAVNLCYPSETFGDKNDLSGVRALVNLWGSPWQNFNFYRVSPGDVPAVIVHGTEDASVAYKNSLELVNQLESNGIANKLISIHGAGHTPRPWMDVFAPQIAVFLNEHALSDE
jgi:acetyl esterase/lipase